MVWINAMKIRSLNYLCSHSLCGILEYVSNNI
jgi:hypothetical protein